jgi:DNA-binding CsgD family transcriptional regulator
VLTLAPLTREASAALVDSQLGVAADDEVRAACFEATGGSPLLLRGVVDELRGREDVRSTDITELHPEGVSRSVRRRLGVLSAQAQALARAVAVLGLSAPLHRAAALGGLGAEEASRAADELAQEHLLEKGFPLRFVHPLVREVVHHLLGPAERASAHARAAVLIRDAGARASEAAAHLLVVEPRGDVTVVGTLLEAAEEAMGRCDPDTTATLMRRALQEPPSAVQRGDVLYLLGLARVGVGDPEGFAHLDSAIEASADHAVRARIALELSQSLRMAAEFQRAVRPLERVLAELPPDSRLAERVEAELINVSMSDPRVASAASARLARFKDPEVLANLKTPGMLANLALMSVSRGAGTEVAVSLARRALAGLDREPEPSVVLYALKALAACDQLDEAGVRWDAFIDQARDQGLESMSAFGCTFRAEVRVWAGSIPDAEADALEATEAYARWGGRPVEPVSMLIHALVERDRLDEAQERLDAVAPPELPGLWDAAVLLCARARLRTAQGRPAEAAADALDAGRIMAPYSSRGVHVAPALLPWRSTAAMAMLADGRHIDARDLAGKEVELARRLGGRPLGVALRTAALANTGEPRLSGLEEAVAVLAASPARLEHARALCALGTALRHAGRRIEARERLREALDRAAGIGGAAVAEEARSELRLAGARPRRDRIIGRHALTASELRIVHLAADGETNRGIAQRLFLTTRTVETHLTHAYAKLDITSRRQLRQAMAAPR